MPTSDVRIVAFGRPKTHQNNPEGNKGTPQSLDSLLDLYFFLACGELKTYHAYKKCMLTEMACRDY